jgi:hypothetical protein
MDGLAKAFAKYLGGGVCEAILMKSNLGKVCWCILGRIGTTRWGIWE